MKRIILALSLSTITAFSALAADVPTKGPTYRAVTAPAPTWTGFYVGIHGAGAWGDTDLGGVVAAPLGGYSVGAQIGYNWQVLPSFVLGAELDYSYADINGGVSILGGALRLNQNVEGIWSARARLGYLPWQNVMLYGTAGYAEAKTEGTLTIAPASAVATATHKGFVYGAGIETMLSKNLSLRAEYLRYDFDDASYLGVNGSLDIQQARVGLNYRF